MPSEPVYVIKKLRWVRINDCLYMAFTSMVNLRVWIEHKGEPWSHSESNTSGSLYKCQQAAERWYQKQLRKALRRVKPSTPRPRHKKKGE